MTQFFQQVQVKNVPILHQLFLKGKRNTVKLSWTFCILHGSWVQDSLFCNHPIFEPLLGVEVLCSLLFSQLQTAITTYSLLLLIFYPVFLLTFCRPCSREIMHVVASIRLFVWPPSEALMGCKSHSMGSSGVQSNSWASKRCLN